MSCYEEKALNELEPINKHILIENLENDTLDIKDITISRSKLINLGLNHAKINNCKITQTVIEDCYLRNAKFQNVDFTGSHFINCNLEKTCFSACTLRYVTFSNCKLNLDEICGNLPYEPNLKISLLKELHKNQNQVCDKKSADSLLQDLLKVEKEELKCKYQCKTSYYKGVPFSSRVDAFYRYNMMVLSDFVWGYGLSIWKLFRSAILLIILFATLIFTSKLQYAATTKNNASIILDFGQAIYTSYNSFTSVGLGEYMPIHTYSKVLFMAENALGLIFVGFLVAALYRRISR